ncbi:MAG: hypothetical protein H0U34_06825 [Sphingomonas sp.]|nr:hypothetical protein [Sphingomonas sp.]
MIAFIKRLWLDRRGSALIIAGVTLPVLVGAAGLAVDTIQWTMWKRQLQRAADSAAFAGVYAKVENNAGMTAEQAVASDLAKHNMTGITLLSGYPQIAYPNPSGYTDAVQVTLAIQKTLGFSSLFMSQAPIITTTGTAAVSEEYTYCVDSRSDSGPGIIIAGSTNVYLGCGAISNSTDSVNSVDVNGTGHTFIAEPVAAVGGIDGTINGSPILRPLALGTDDVYADLSTDIPDGMPCANFNNPSQTNADGSKKPGCYDSFNLGGGTVNLSPGVYYLNSTDINLTGQERLVGTGVTIILTGSDPGSLTMSGNSSMDLTAPTTGTYANMVLIQASNADTGNNNTINGDNNTALDGVIYFPVGDLTFSGSSAGATQCAMIVGWTITFTGNANIQNTLVRPDGTPCRAAEQVDGRKVRLIA